LPQFHFKSDHRNRKANVLHRLDIYIGFEPNNKGQKRTRPRAARPDHWLRPGNARFVVLSFSYRTGICNRPPGRPPGARGVLFFAGSCLTVFVHVSWSGKSQSTERPESNHKTSPNQKKIIRIKIDAWQNATLPLAWPKGKTTAPRNAGRKTYSSACRPGVHFFFFLGFLLGPFFFFL